MNLYWVWLLSQRCIDFLLHDKVTQMYVYMYPLCFGLPPHSGHDRALSRGPCAAHEVLLSFLFIDNTIYMPVPIPQLIPPLIPFGNLKDLEIVTQSESSQEEKNKHHIPFLDTCCLFTEQKIMLSERGETQKNKYCLIAFIWNLIIGKTSDRKQISDCLHWKLPNTFSY